MMEKHMNHGIINGETERPDAALLQRFRNYSSALVYDAIGGSGAMYSEVKPIQRGMKCVGSACTVHSTPGDALYVVIACDVAKAGDVIVVDDGRFYEGNAIGDGMAKYMFERTKLSGFVCDGGVRDIEGIISVGLPTFGASVSVKHIGSNAHGAINIPIVCGGQVVNPGDIIVADDDGVVVVNKSDAMRVASRCDALLALERVIERCIDEGVGMSEVLRLRKTLREREADE